MDGEGVGTAESMPEIVSAGGESTTIHGGGKVDHQSDARISMRSDHFDAPGLPSYLQVGHQMRGVYTFELNFWREKGYHD